ncbi:hypothetical protein PAAL109150_01770 [Paenibacillus alkaliterrae]
MKLSSISDDFFELVKFDKELMDNTNRRPYLIILRLKYSGIRQDFAVPFRSNIDSNTPKDQYFSLPPRKTTQKHHVHGLHYLKMFPIKSEYLRKFNVENNPYYATLLGIINKNLKTIVKDAQKYLDDYQNGRKQRYCTNIDGIYLAMNQILEVKDVAPAKENNNG